MKLSREQREAIEKAISALDAAWDYDAERGLQDGRDGSEYKRISSVPVLREMLEEG